MKAIRFKIFFFIFLMSYNLSFGQEKIKFGYHTPEGKVKKVDYNIINSTKKSLNESFNDIKTNLSNIPDKLPTLKTPSINNKLPTLKSPSINNNLPTLNTTSINNKLPILNNNNTADKENSENPD